jgi:hypothetical protein
MLTNSPPKLTPQKSCTQKHVDYENVKNKIKQTKKEKRKRKRKTLLDVSVSPFSLYNNDHG